MMTIQCTRGLLVCLLAAACGPIEAESSRTPGHQALSATLPGPTWTRTVRQQLLREQLRAQVFPATGERILNRPGFRAVVGPAGLSILSLDEDVRRTNGLLGQHAIRTSWGLHLHLMGLTGTSQESLLPSPTLAHQANRVWADHDHQVIHLVINQTEALTQRFYVMRDMGATFALDLQPEGPVQLGLCDQGELCGRYRDRIVLRASAPRAFDADGRELPAAYELSADRLRIRVTGASRYPVLIDPDWTAHGDDRANAWFGWNVAPAGDQNHDGKDDVLVSTPFYSQGVNSRMGKVFLYQGSAVGLNAYYSWSSSGDEQNEAWFGWSARMVGDLNGDGYPDIAIGAPGQDDMGQSNTGKVFVYYGGADGPGDTPNWTHIAKNDENAFFGLSVAAAGDVNGDSYDDLVAGAPYFNPYQPGAESDHPGQAFLYCGSNSGLSTTYTWNAVGDNQNNAAFGFSVDGAGDTNQDGFDDLVIGAPLFDTTGENAGAAYLYLGAASGPDQIEYSWSAHGNDQAHAQFGWSVSSAGDIHNDGFADVLIGAPQYDSTQNGTGRVYLYQGGHPENGLHATAQWNHSGSELAGALFGWSVSGASDVNGDGFDDILIGAPGDDTYADGAGRAFMFFGTVGGLLSQPARLLWGDAQTQSGFGISVAGAGDVNGDGLADMIIGAYLHDTEFEDAGRAYLFLGESGSSVPCNPPGSVCDDQNDCTRSDRCGYDGICRGTPFTCDDEDPCTDDVCRADGSCGHLFNQATCDDENPCTIEDRCSTGGCTGKPMDCSLLDDYCTYGECDPSQARCVSRARPDGTICDDNNPCTSGDKCRSGVCQYTKDVCNDGGDDCSCSQARPGITAWLLLAIGLMLRRRRTA